MIYYYCPANGDKYISLGLLCTRSFNFELTRLPLSDEKYEDKNIILLKPFFLIELWLDLSYNGALHNDFCKMCICTYTFFFNFPGCLLVKLFKMYFHVLFSQITQTQQKTTVNISHLADKLDSIYYNAANINKCQYFLWLSEIIHWNIPF